MSERVILTVAPESESTALTDLKRAFVGHDTRCSDPGVTGLRDDRSEPLFRSIHSLAPGILLITMPIPFAELASRLRERPPLFIRHVQPVQREVRLQGDAADLADLSAAALELASGLAPEESFSVQTRLSALLTPSSASPALAYGRFEVNERLSAALQASTGAPLDVRAPVQVLSVMVTPSAGYLGLSRAQENLSSWAGGAIRFAREPGQVSRSEFKLLEALQVFHLALPVAGTALDLGAAPGGWTRLLRRSGLEVTAVDPGDLDPRVASDPGVRHVRLPAQQFHCRQGEFAVIVNDMRMDARDSARLMLDYAPCLSAEGFAVMTLKLPHHLPEEVTHQAIELLLRRYDLIGARQLFHNRSEITVVLRPRVGN